MSQLDLEESAFLAKLSSKVNHLTKRVEELEEEKQEVEIGDEIYSMIQENASIENVTVLDGAIEFELTDGRTVQIPIRWSWKLQNADSTERENYEISEDGSHVFWPDIDEDISIHGILVGDPAPRPESE